MKKIKLNITIITNQAKEEYNLLGEYDKENKIITYTESNNLLTTMLININNHKLIRENKDYYIEYNLIENKETDNIIRVKDINHELKLKIKTEKFELKENKLEIKYKVIDSNEDITYIIKF